MKTARCNRTWHKLRRHPLAMVGLSILAILYGVMLAAEFIAPYAYDNGKRELSYVPPSAIRFVHRGRFNIRPFVYPYSYSFNKYYERVFVEDTTRPYYIRLFAKGDPVRLFGVIPMRRHLFGIEGNADSCRIYLLGGDAVGRDLLSRLIYGARVSLTIGLLGVAITFTIGSIVGGVAGYFGGKIDAVIMRFAECYMLIPGFFLMLALRSAFPVSMSSVKVYFLIVVIMGFIGWAEFARVVRGMALSISKRPYVIAAKATGAGDLRIILRHVLPQTTSHTIVSLTLSIPGYILGESALSLIGLGIQEPQASWGNMLSAAMNVADIQYHPWVLTPGVLIVVTVMAFNFLGDGLRDALDPNR